MSFLLSIDALNASIVTVAVFIVFAYAPGLWLLTPFRSAFGGALRQAAALLLGWAFYTFFADVALKAFGPTLWGFYLAPGFLVWTCAAAARIFGEKSSVEESPPLSVCRTQASFACLLGVVAVLQVFPIEWNGGLYWGTPEIDWRSRLPVTNAIARDGLPAANPFFNPEGDSKLFFYYGFFLLPAACVHPGLQSGSGWDAVGVMSLCAFLIGTLTAVFAMALGNFAAGDRRGGWVSGFLCYVTGLDLLPVLALTLRGTPPSSIEWWNPAQITAVTAFPVWAPHHALATLEVILAHILAWKLQPANDEFSRDAQRSAPLRVAAKLGILALLLAAAAMTSTYVAMLGFLSIFIHGVSRIWRTSDWRTSDWRSGALPIAATILGGVLVLPFYYQLSKIDEYRGPSIQPILRPCPSEEPIHEAVAAAIGVSKPVALFLTRLGGLLPQYFFELGFLFFVLIFWKRTGIGPRDPDGLWNRFGVMVVTAFVVGSIFVSVRTWNCDLNWRIMHPVQIALLGAAAAFWKDRRSKPRPTIDKLGLGFFIAVGIAGTCYDLARSRWDYLSDPEKGRKARVAAEAAAWANERIESGARIALDPRTFGGVGNPFILHLLKHQVAMADDSFNAYPYGPDKDQVERVKKEMTEAFSAQTPMVRREEILRRYKVRCAYLDRWSEIFGKDVETTFGHLAAAKQNRTEDEWKFIILWRTSSERQSNE